MNGTEIRRLNIRLEPAVHRAVRIEAAERDLTVQELVEGWIRERVGGREITYPVGGGGAAVLADGPRSG